MQEVGIEFHGAKLAVLSRGEVLTLQRDNDPDIPWPGYWDLPGGGREGSETPVACVLRELHEELALVLEEDVIGWQRRYPSLSRAGDWSWFLAADLGSLRPGPIILGDEGQRWQWMPVEAFLASRGVVPYFRGRLSEALQGMRAGS